MKRLTVERVKAIHSLMLAETGGLGGIRDAAMLRFRSTIDSAASLWLNMRNR